MLTAQAEAQVLWRDVGSAKGKSLPTKAQADDGGVAASGCRPFAECIYRAWRGRPQQTARVHKVPVECPQCPSCNFFRVE